MTPHNARAHVAASPSFASTTPPAGHGPLARVHSDAAPLVHVHVDDVSRRRRRLAWGHSDDGAPSRAFTATTRRRSRSRRQCRAAAVKTPRSANSAFGPTPPRARTRGCVYARGVRKPPPPRLSPHLRPLHPALASALALALLTPRSLAFTSAHSRSSPHARPRRSPLGPPPLRPRSRSLRHVCRPTSALAPIGAPSLLLHPGSLHPGSRYTRRLGPIGDGAQTAVFTGTRALGFIYLPTILTDLLG